MDQPPDFSEAPTQPGAGFPAGGRADGPRERIRRSLLLRIALTILLTLIVLLALVPAFLFYRRAHPVFTAAKLGDIVLTVSAQGTVQATVYSASFAVPGTVAQISVLPGQRVRAGDTLATLDTTAAKSAVSAAQSSVSDAQSSVNAAQSGVSQAQSAVSTAQSSLSTQQSNAATQCSVQPPDADACAAATAAVARAQAQLALAQAQLSAGLVAQARAQSALDNAQYALRVAQTGLAETTLMAPHDGIVLTVNGENGDLIAPGGAPFVTLADTAQPLATGLVNYRDIAAVEDGELATLRVKQAVGSPLLTGSVVAVTLIPQGSGDQLAYPVSIRIDPESLKGANLLPGMDASFVITTRSRLDVVTLPVSVISYARQAAPPSGKGLLTAEQIKAALEAAETLKAQAIADGLDVEHDPPTASYLIGFENGKYVAIPVVLGLSNGKRQEIIAGVSEGQKVVSGQRNPFLG